MVRLLFGHPLPHPALITQLSVTEFVFRTALSTGVTSVGAEGLDTVQGGGGGGGGGVGPGGVGPTEQVPQVVEPSLQTVFGLQPQPLMSPSGEQLVM
jgi:hypothetical protein